MKSKSHQYQTKLTWSGNLGQGTTRYDAYERTYQIKVDNKPVITGSADPAFRGDATRYNPEELFLMSLSSCHMLWYLHLCAVNGVVVTEYEDEANGIMREDTLGSGKFEIVTLCPKVKITDPAQNDLALTLHQKANQMCFIANSCNFDVDHQASIIN